MKRYIVADIGGTNARFALMGNNRQLEQLMVLPCADYPRIHDAIYRFIDAVGSRYISGICLAIAGPVDNDEINLLNNHWGFRQSELTRQLGVPLKVINDFTAQALCLDYLQEDEIEWLGEPRPQGQQIRGIVGPGTGFGVAALMPNGDVLPSEAGHIAFAPTSSHQIELLKALQERFGRVSVERVLSGQGLENLYWGNAKLQRGEKRLAARDIAALATDGDELALQAVNDLFDIFASTAGDMALALWAAGGIYLAGGVLEKLEGFLDAERFRRYFSDKGRFSDYCRSVPIGIIKARHSGLLGCYGALRFDG